MTLFYLFDLFQIEKFSRPQILARPVGHLCLSSHSPSKKEIIIILLPISMATSKNIQTSTIATSTKLGTTTTTNCIGANNRSQLKANNQLQAQSTKQGRSHIVAWGGRDPCKKKKKIPLDYEEKINRPPQH